jgi:hypothetical protein
MRKITKLIQVKRIATKSSGFTIIIDDGYCAYQTTTNTLNMSINDIFNIIKKGIKNFK